jgi:hypothetical protein
MRTTRPSDYVHKRYCIALPKTMHVTTVSLPWMEHLATHRAGGIKELSAIVRAEAAKLRETGHGPGALSAAVLKAVGTAGAPNSPCSVLNRSPERAPASSEKLHWHLVPPRRSRELGRSFAHNLSVSENAFFSSTLVRLLDATT